MAFFNVLKRKKVPLPEKGTAKPTPATRALGKVTETKREKEKSEKREKKADVSGASVRVDASREGGESIAHVIMHPRITEKASFITEDGAYTFDVSPRANKAVIKKAIEEIYGVTPVRINVITIPAKKVFVRNRVGMKASGKKAVVYLKKGDKIEFV